MFIHKLPVEPSPVLVHYIGDASIFVPQPHGNEIKKPTKDYFSTAAPTNTAIKQSNGKHPQDVYESMKSQPDARVQPAFGPRNLKQV
jgi:hypothetical protein